MSAQKNRITYKEFIEEQMAGYKNENTDRLQHIIRDLLEGVWDEDNVSQVLAEKGRELIQEKVQEEQLKCHSCQENLYTLIRTANQATVYRVRLDGLTMYLSEESQLKELDEAVEEKCTHCAETLNLSRFKIQVVD